MLSVDLSPTEEKIIRHLCDVQIESFTKLKEKDSSAEVDSHLAAEQVSASEFMDIVNAELEKYHLVRDTPAKMFSLEHMLFNTLKEMTINYEAELTELFEAELPDFWKKLFLAEYIWSNMN
ncbi:MAG TPA: hypothetical protein PKK99_15640 [Bacteroidia bacterium]|nr:hypothetical protein [Bacteroidia bacterium]HNQ00494.1 hypothetical protein [Bacteroidia bacterium]